MEDHSFTFTGIVCHDDATCRNYDGVYGCQCNDGYYGDGIENCLRKLILFYKQNSTLLDEICLPPF